MENHPIQIERPDATQEQRILWLEHHVAMLWDQVWWMNLPPDQRAAYQREGYSDPIQAFYDRDDPWPRKLGT